MNQWIFTHGSLMNAPPFESLDSVTSVAPAWRRTFGHPSVRNWGTAAAPAPTSALVPGSGAVGVAHLVGPAEIEHVVEREASLPVEIDISILGRRRPALAWVMTDVWSAWSAGMLARAAVDNVRSGGGPFGDALAYLDTVIGALVVRGQIDPLATDYRAAYQVLQGRDEDL